MKKLIYLAIVWHISFNVQAQVTIGMDTPPAKGAILDLKEKDAPNGDETSSKSIVLPRVKLISLTSLEPLLSGADATDTTEKLTHKGSVVYNITVSADLQEGLYYWDGNKWNCAQGDGAAWKNTGNAGTDADVNFLGTSDNQPLVLKANNNEGLRIATDGKVGINTDNPETALDINGELTVRNVSELNLGQNSQAKQLYVDSSTGLVGLQPAGTQAVAPMFFANAYRTVLSSSAAIINSFNAGSAIMLTPQSNDVVINNLDVTLTGNNFKIKHDGIYQITSSVNFQIATDNPGYLIYINVRMEKSSDGGANWAAITGTRPVLTVYWNTGEGQFLPVNLPVTVQKLKDGDMLRFVFIRTNAGGQEQGEKVSKISVIGAYATPAFSLSLNKL
jgi:hypothetical protein